MVLILSLMDFDLNPNSSMEARSPGSQSSN